MPAMANIVLADAQATPVNHTFVPIGRDEKGLFWYEDQSAASQIGNWKISVEIKRPAPPAQGQAAVRNYRIVIGLHEPALENVTNNTVSGIAPAPTLSYLPRAFVDYVLPERASLQNRKDLRKMIANLQNDSQVVAVVEQLQYLFA